MILPSRSRRGRAGEVGAYRWNSCGESEISAPEKQQHRMSSKSYIEGGLGSGPMCQELLVTGA